MLWREVGAMTEAEWLVCEYPLPMVRFLHDKSDWKRRHFVVACARAIWEQIPEGDMREALNTAEHYADGLVNVAERFEHNLALEEAIVTMMRFLHHDGGDDDPCAVAVRGFFKGYLYDIFGNPFRPVEFSPEWRTDTAVALARQMYESREFSAMPILADALQDAGCDNDDILNHCRDTTLTHVRGCWVVDLVLGKE
jgi:hypothetical protein